MLLSSFVLIAASCGGLRSWLPWFGKGVRWPVYSLEAPPAESNGTRLSFCCRVALMNVGSTASMPAQTACSAPQHKDVFFFLTIYEQNTKYKQGSDDGTANSVPYRGALFSLLCAFSAIDHMIANACLLPSPPASALLVLLSCRSGM